MPENIPNDFERSTVLELAGGETVAKEVGAKERAPHVRSFCPAPHPLTDRGVPQRPEWNRVADKHLTAAGVSRATVVKIGCDRLGDAGQQWQVHGGAVLGSPEMDDAGVPINLLKLQTTDLGGAQSVRTEENVLGVIAAT